MVILMTEMIEADISGAVRTFHKAGVNVKQAVPKLLARLSMKGEGFMKQTSITPYRTGTLRRSIHAHPTNHPVGIAAGVNYAFAANVRSRKPQFIEKTRNYIVRIAPHETDIIVRNALKGMNK